MVCKASIAFPFFCEKFNQKIGKSNVLAEKCQNLFMILRSQKFSFDVQFVGLTEIDFFPKNFTRKAIK